LEIKVANAAEIKEEAEEEREMKHFAEKKICRPAARLRLPKSS